MTVEVRMTNIRHGEDKFSHIVYATLVRSSDNKIILDANISRVLEQVRLGNFKLIGDVGK